MSGSPISYFLYLRQANKYTKDIKEMKEVGLSPDKEI
jgi:hypothetical protein